jgi:CRP/FNR family transcriptional regulator, cyclic AMP receptor protein
MPRVFTGPGPRGSRLVETRSPGSADLRDLEHQTCSVVSGLLRGKLCAQLLPRPARHITAGQYLYFAGEAATSIFFLRRGLVKTSRTSPAGDDMILQLHRGGDILGESCFCTGERHEDALALEPSEVSEILIEDLLAQLQRDPDATRELVTALCERLGDLSSRLQSLSFEPAIVRLVRTLLMLAETLGESAAGGTNIVHYVRQEQLAQMIAARREVVSGLLNRLRANGLIDYSRKGHISVHRDALKAYLTSLTSRSAL